MVLNIRHSELNIDEVSEVYIRWIGDHSVKLDGIQLDSVAHLLQPSHRPTSVVFLRNVYQYKHMYIF